MLLQIQNNLYGRIGKENFCSLINMLQVFNVGSLLQSICYSIIDLD